MSLMVWGVKGGDLPEVSNPASKRLSNLKPWHSMSIPKVIRISPSIHRKAFAKGSGRQTIEVTAATTTLCSDASR